LVYYVSGLPVVKRNYRLVRNRELTTPVFVDLLTNGNPICNSSVVVRTTLMCEINSFSEQSELVGSEDFYGWIH
jgi:hypothetical protein